jgi:hypothetical protein
LRKWLVVTTMACVLLFGLVGIAFAARTGNHGQPSQSCEDPATSTTPGNAGNPSNTGSPFSPNGTSGGVYANGPGTGGPNGAITNPTAVSQYDVACFQNSQPHS